MVLNKKSIIHKGLTEYQNSSECLQKLSCKIISENVLNLQNVNISPQPVHIMDKTRKHSPSAFIPFCAFGGQNIGTKIKKFSEPVCTNFQQVIFEGRVCYKFQVDKNRHNIRQGRKNGLKLLIDFNQDRALASNPESNNPEDHSIVKNLFHDLESDEKELDPEKDITVHINTILPYTAVRGGIFKLSGIKQMETTADFDILDVLAKKCQK